MRQSALHHMQTRIYPSIFDLVLFFFRGAIEVQHHITTIITTITTDGKQLRRFAIVPGCHGTAGLVGARRAMAAPPRLPALMSRVKALLRPVRTEAVERPVGNGVPNTSGLRRVVPVLLLLLSPFPFLFLLPPILYITCPV